jgi:hypothetical protein
MTPRKLIPYCRRRKPQTQYRAYLRDRDFQPQDSGAITEVFAGSAIVFLRKNGTPQHDLLSAPAKNAELDENRKHVILSQSARAIDRLPSSV